MVSTARPLVGSAQWTRSPSPLLTQNQATNGGCAIQFCDGVVWAAHAELMRSDDSGVTWRDVALPGSGYITSIDFINRDTGVVSTHDQIAYTTDGGTSWSTSPSSVIQSATLAGDGHTIVCVSGGNMIHVSVDAGSTWQTRPTPSFPTHITFMPDGSLTLLNGYTPTASLSQSPDHGTTFTRIGAPFGGDCWSFASDSCGGTYVVNEEFFAHNLTRSSVVHAHYNGDVWQSVFEGDLPFLCGSVCTSLSAVYVQSLSKGVCVCDRNGGSWISIGGPHQHVDSRTICAIGERWVIASDSLGYIWRYQTDTSRPASAHVVVSPTILFANDSLNNCDSISDVVIVSSGPCSGLHLLSAHISGSDSTSYHIFSSIPTVLSGADSIRIAFRPNGLRDFHGILTLTFDGDSERHIALAGHGLALGASLAYQNGPLFERDSVTPCDPARSAIFRIFDSTCWRHRVISQRFIGADSSYYRLSERLPDSLGLADSAVIWFQPDSVRAYAASLVVLLDDSTHIVVPLQGACVAPRRTVRFAPGRLFDTDTILLCAPLLTRSVILEDSSCLPWLVDSVTIVGSDSVDFSIANTYPSPLQGHDTISVTFVCPAPGDFQATLLIHLSDGTELTIPMIAHATEPVFLGPERIHNPIDTIGDITLPIECNLKVLPYDVSIRMRFDTSKVIFIGTFGPDGSRRSKLTSSGEVEIELPKGSQGDATNMLAYSQFEFYPTSDSCTSIVCDSVVILGTTALPCKLDTWSFAYSLCPEYTCYTPFIVDVMRNSQLMLWVRPNPAMDCASLLSNSAIDDARITLFDALGTPCFSKQGSIKAGEALDIPLTSLPSGVFGLRVEMGNRTKWIRVLHIQ
ncbi:MAG: hypothetical protein Q8913_05655 [Bacteroidota bacterium]|nr:hypothetical protein [Bacteroidota bacterium]